jgi:beta-1,3-galactosyltransferase 1
VIAEPKDDKTQKELESEVFVNKDILQFDFKDSYFNLTLKSIALLRWAHQNCLHSKYIFKIDDIIVNVEHLLKNVHNLQNGITGYLMSGMPVIREVKSPWFMPECTILTICVVRHI